MSLPNETSITYTTPDIIFERFLLPYVMFALIGLVFSLVFNSWLVWILYIGLIIFLIQKFYLSYPIYRDSLQRRAIIIISKEGIKTTNTPLITWENLCFVDIILDTNSTYNDCLLFQTATKLYHYPIDFRYAISAQYLHTIIDSYKTNFLTNQSQHHFHEDFDNPELPFATYIGAKRISINAKGSNVKKTDVVSRKPNLFQIISYFLLLCSIVYVLIGIPTATTIKFSDLLFLLLTAFGLFVFFLTQLEMFFNPNILKALITINNAGITITPYEIHTWENIKKLYFTEVWEDDTDGVYRYYIVYTYQNQEIRKCYNAYNITPQEFQDLCRIYKGRHHRNSQQS